MIKRFKKVTKNHIFWDLFLVSFLLILFLLLFWKLILRPGYIYFGDNGFIFDKLYLSSWGSHESNGIQRELILPLIFYKVLFVRFFTFFGLEFQAISKITYLLPIFLALLSSFMVLRKVSRSPFYALIGSTLFILSVTSVEYMTVSFVMYFLHIVSVFFLTYLVYSWGFRWDNINYKKILILVLLSLLNLHPFFFVTYILYILFYLLFSSFIKYKFTNLFKGIAIFTLIIAINLFWLLPFLMSIIFTKTTPGSVYGESNYNAVLSGVVSHSSLYKILIGSVYPIRSLWDTLFNNYLLLVPFVIFLILALFINNSFKSKYKFGTFVSIVFIIFLSLSFWPSNPILGWVWDYSMDNYSFFGFFRSFNRFITVLLPISLVGVGMYYSKNSRRGFFNVLLFVLFALVLLGRKNLMSGDLGGIVPIYSIPSEYILLNEEMLSFKDSKKENPRVLIYPKTDYESYIWNKNSNYDEISAGFFFLDRYLDAEILMSKYGNHVFITEDFFKNLFNPDYCLEEDKYLEDLKKIDANYVLLNKDLITRKGDIVFFENYRYCIKNSNFSLVLSNEYFELYKINYGKEYKKNYTITEVYPFYYKVNFDFNGQENSEFIFPQNFNSGWKLYFDSGGYMGYLEKNAIPFYDKEIQIEHIDNEPGNKWVLNRNDFNNDNVTLNLYYYPQIYVVIGSVISLFSAVTLVTVGVTLEIKNVKKIKVTNVQ